MFTIESRIHVDGISGQEIYDFLLDCTDERYQAWWPGTHLRLHSVARGEDHVGDVMFMDEYVGRRRVRNTIVVVEAVRGHRIVWQFGRRFRLPVRLTLELTDQDGGVDLRHVISVGYRGIGRVFDPLLRLYFDREFAAAMDEHVRTEFPLIRDRIPRAEATSNQRVHEPAPAKTVCAARLAGPQVTPGKRE
ncbi:Polyketide cyclase / dehydrase and lipid transport [Mycobacterium lentiflavum]|uniref:Polyketide cyclase / dehydrase and lipid transport n=1 Tax=Mycobacterium lentiflavum TaxID=141349 RepID=A0A0E4H227_MYCLN|nr:SRPBCC family protein [Mycobacterium lentiflavum]CQD24363.1 Polyketide cyclase / dehydrase and lipid transport [Mycobacterium lentiflavum]